jgi:spore coat polysaccharide biosynthesis protein SpsF
MGGPRVVAIVQARVGSTRLPGKALLPLAGTPMVIHVLRRVMAVRGVDEVAVAIPDGAADDVLAAVVREAETDARLVRGPENDVLARYDLAATSTRAEVVLRITADCPMFSPAVGTRVLSAFVDCDYASNTQPRSFPRGLDTEVFSRDALAAAHQEASASAEREHVTPFIYRRPERFTLRNVTDTVDRSDLRWTVDTPEDLAFADAVYAALGPRFEMHDVLALLADQPYLAKINAGSLQKELGQ